MDDDLKFLLDELCKICGQQVETGGYLIRPSGGELLNRKEIAATIDESRSVLKLRAQIADAVSQLIARASAGDEDAFCVLLLAVRGLIDNLRVLERSQPDTVRKLAEESAYWPVLISQSPRDLQRAKETARRLRVGEKAAFPKRPGQKVDPKAFWTQLALTAFGDCRTIAFFVQLCNGVCAGVAPKPLVRKLFGISAPANEYSLPPNHLIIIADWEKRCVNLPLPVTRNNVNRWWDVVKHYTLENWLKFPREYQEALRHIKIGKNPEDKEPWQWHNMAIGRVERAFRDLFRLR
jgi:hypothetical protein